MMDTTEMVLTTGMGTDMLNKEVDVDMIEGNAKDIDIDRKAQDECLRSIHCDGSCNKDCGVGEEEYLDLDECITNIRCPGGCSQAGGHIVK